MVEVCEHLFGEDGYMIYNLGKEQGIDCIDNAVYEDIKTYEKFLEVTKDIVKNKETEYPNLKVIVLDTLDQLITITEPYIINEWNKQNIKAKTKDFKVAQTMNASWTGFGKGEDKLIEELLDRIWELHEVGVRCWYTGHVKMREVVDAVTMEAYNKLSTQMMTKYFNGFKTKMHVVGVACIDRTIEKESTGRKNVVTGKDITLNRVKEEKRKIVFRDDNYSVESKSRFANIVDEVPMDRDAFIQSLEDAIASSARPSVSPRNDKENLIAKQIKNKEPEPDFDEPILDEPVVDEPVIEETVAVEAAPAVEDDDEIPFSDLDDDDLETPPSPEEMRNAIRDGIKACTDVAKKRAMSKVIKEYGNLSAVPEDELVKLYNEI